MTQYNVYNYVSWDYVFTCRRVYFVCHIVAPKLKNMLLQLTSSEVMSPTLFANSTASVIRRDGQSYMLTEMVPGVGRRW